MTSISPSSCKARFTAAGFFVGWRVLSGKLCGAADCLAKYCDWLRRKSDANTDTHTNSDSL